MISFYYVKGQYKKQWRLVQIYRKTYSYRSNFVKFDGIDVTGINSGLIRLWEDDDPKVVLLKEESDIDCPVLL